MITGIVASEYLLGGGRSRPVESLTREQLVADVSDLSTEAEAGPDIVLGYKFDGPTSMISKIFVFNVGDVNFLVQHYHSQWESSRRRSSERYAYTEHPNPRQVRAWDGQTAFRLSESFLIPHNTTADILHHFLLTAELLPSVRWVTFEEVGWSPELPSDEVA